ncbi:MAG: hypothetical protein ACKO85_15115 [Isosphaeraceae bacterium]
MSGPVHVQSIEVLQAVKAALMKFQEEAQAVVNGTDMDLRRIWHWLEHEMPSYWQSRMKRLEVELNEAKNALFRKRLQAQGTDRPAFDTVEKQEVKRLEGELEKARLRLEAIRRWRMRFERDVSEFNARMRGIKDEVGGGIERHGEFLDSLIQAIEAYSAIAAPKASSAGSSGGTTSPTPSTENEEPKA